MTLVRELLLLAADVLPRPSDNSLHADAPRSLASDTVQSPSFNLALHFLVWVVELCCNASHQVVDSLVKNPREHATHAGQSDLVVLEVDSSDFIRGF